MGGTLRHRDHSRAAAETVGLYRHLLTEERAVAELSGAVAAPGQDRTVGFEGIYVQIAALRRGDVRKKAVIVDTVMVDILIMYLDGGIPLSGCAVAELAAVVRSPSQHRAVEFEGV